MALTKVKIMAIVAAVIITILNLTLFYGTKLFSFLIGLAFLILILPFLIDIISRSSREKEKEEMFIEFTRDLSESVHAGTPISKSVIHLANRDYGALNAHVKKLANQLSLAIPLRQAFKTFALSLS